MSHTVAVCIDEDGSLDFVTTGHLEDAANQGYDYFQYKREVTFFTYCPDCGEKIDGDITT